MLRPPSKKAKRGFIQASFCLRFTKAANVFGD